MQRALVVIPEEGYALELASLLQAAEAEQAADAIPLREAVYCENCGNVSTRMQNMECLCCGSAATLDLSRILNRVAISDEAWIFASGEEG